MPVKNYMRKELYNISPETTVEEAVNIMSEANIGALIIGDADNIQGIFSERDVLNRVIGKNKDVSLPVKEFMSREVIKINENTSGTQALRLMDSKRVRHLPVINDTGKCIGILGSRNLLLSMLKHLESSNEILMEHYIEISRVAIAIEELLLSKEDISCEKIVLKSELPEFKVNKIIDNLINENILLINETKIQLKDRTKLEKKII